MKLWLELFHAQPGIGDRKSMVNEVINYQSTVMARRTLHFHSRPAGQVDDIMTSYKLICLMVTSESKIARYKISKDRTKGTTI